MCPGAALLLGAVFLGRTKILDNPAGALNSLVINSKQVAYSCDWAPVEVLIMIMPRGLCERETASSWFTASVYEKWHGALEGLTK